MQTENSNPFAELTFRRLLVPIVVTIITSGYLIYLLSKSDFSATKDIELTWRLFYFLLLALGTVLLRDAAYVYRIWELSDRKLSLWKSIEVILLWEFGSAITPASVGGVSLAFFILYKEGIKPGMATSILMLCSYLDNVAFIIAFGSLFFLLGGTMFDLSADCGNFGQLTAVRAFRALGEYIWLGILAVTFFGSLLGFAIFIRPQYSSIVLNKIATLPILNKWSLQIKGIGEDIYTTSKFFKNKGQLFLLRVLMATLISWTARYFLANVLIAAFASGDIDQLFLFGRQCVHRVIVMIPATPGASGLAELSFMALNCEFVKEGISPLIALIWRGLNFYIYIIIGILVLPGWLARVSKN
jgi:uncharacterized membrane protein YbhN (UPF0104 family)